jgi:hypothetical protein
MKHFFQLIKKTFIFIFCIHYHHASWIHKESQHFIVHYPESFESITTDYLLQLERYRPYLVEKTGHDYPNKAVIVLEDYGTVHNAYCNLINERIHVYLEPPSSHSVFVQESDWLTNTTLHELTHLYQMTKKTGLNTIFGSIVGNIVSPQLSVPNWFAEGIAVWMESNWSPYIGRLNDGTYHAILREKALANALPTIDEANFCYHQYPTDGWYVYGALFVEYLADTYGDEKLTLFIDELSGRNILTGIQSAFVSIYGKSTFDLYNEWIVHTYKNTQAHLDNHTQLTDSNWGKSHLIKIDNDRFAYIDTMCSKPDVATFSYTHTINEYDINTDQNRILTTIRATSNANLQHFQNKLYYTEDVKSPSFQNTEDGYGYIQTLKSINLDTLEKKTIYTDAIRSFHMTDAGMLIFKNNSSDPSTTVHRLENDGELSELGCIPLLISEICDNKLNWIVVAKEPNRVWSIYQIDKQTFKHTPLIDSQYAEIEATLTNNSIIFSAPYVNRSRELYEYDLGTEIIFSLTNDHYASRGIVIDDNVIYIGLTSNGMDLFKCIYKPESAIIDDPVYIINDTFDPETIQIGESKSSSKHQFQSLFPSLRYPYINLHKGSFDNEFVLMSGLVLEGNDLFQSVQYRLNMEYGNSNLDNTYYKLSLNSQLRPYGALKIDYDFSYQRDLIDTTDASLSDTTLTNHKLAFHYPIYQNQEQSIRLNTFGNVSVINKHTDDVQPRKYRSHLGLSLVKTGDCIDTYASIHTDQFNEFKTHTQCLYKLGDASLSAGHIYYNNYWASALLPLASTNQPTRSELSDLYAMKRSTHHTAGLKVTTKLGSVNKGYYDSIGIGDIFVSGIASYSTKPVVVDNTELDHQYEFGIEVTTELHLKSGILPLTIGSSWNNSMVTNPIYFGIFI